MVLRMPLSKLLARLPAQFAFDLAAINGIATIVPRPVFYKCDQLADGALGSFGHSMVEYRANAFRRFRCCVFRSPSTDVVSLSRLPRARARSESPRNGLQQTTSRARSVRRRTPGAPCRRGHSGSPAESVFPGTEMGRSYWSNWWSAWQAVGVMSKPAPMVRSRLGRRIRTVGRVGCGLAKR